METNIEGTIMETHIEVRMYGATFRGYNVWRLI